ncbi:MAG: type 4a pilus biogenesis protein PilO [Armatimonadetes bacterium]|nr:type 4a pilus biogenesis protein PilO [Armatimonadota bacterium]
MAQINLKPSQKGVALLAIAAGLVFVICLLSCLAAVGKVRSVEAEKKQVEANVRDSLKVAQTQMSTENRYLDTRAQIRSLESSVSTQAYVPTLLKQLEQLGGAVSLKVLGVRPQPPDPNAKMAEKQAAMASAENSGSSGAATEEKPEPPKPYDDLLVDLELEGQYMNALDFLYKLTTFPKIIAVNSIEMSPTSGINATGNPQLSIKINATAFVFKEATPVKRKQSDDSAGIPAEAKNEAG